MTAKEKEVIVPKTETTVVATTKPEKKDVKPVKKKEDKPKSAENEIVFEAPMFKDPTNTFLRNGRLITLKETAITQDMLNSNWPLYLVHEMMNSIKEKYAEGKTKIEHAIVDGVLYVLVGSSRLIMSQTNYFLDIDNEPSVTYLGDEGVVPPVSGVILFDSTINTPSLLVNGLSALYECTFNVKSSMRLEGKNTLRKTSTYNASHLLMKESMVKNCSFSGNNIEIKDTNSDDVSLHAKYHVNLTGAGYAPRNNLSVSGNIDTIVIKSDCFPYSRQMADISYRGDNSVDVITTRRVDNGYFMGVDPIPFMRTLDGILVGNTHFTYAEIRKFYVDIAAKVRPAPEERPYSFNPQPFGSISPILGNSLGLRDDFGAVHKKMVSLLKGQNRYHLHSRKSTLTTADEFDPALRIRNEQVLVLAEQINSRLKTFIELDTMGV